MNQEQIQQKIQDICTTHKEHGGGYYNLSEEQFQGLFEMVAEALGAQEKDIINLIRIKGERFGYDTYKINVNDLK